MEDKTPDWNIRYSEYVDDLVLFSGDIYLKIENASRYLGYNIEEMQIPEILEKLKELHG